MSLRSETTEAISKVLDNIKITARIDWNYDTVCLPD